MHRAGWRVRMPANSANVGAATKHHRQLLSPPSLLHPCSTLWVPAMENGVSSVSTSGSMQRKVDVSFTFVPTSIHVVVGHHCFNKCAIKSACHQLPSGDAVSTASAPLCSKWVHECISHVRVHLVSASFGRSVARQGRREGGCRQGLAPLRMHSTYYYYSLV
jgi:hypothetical protein